MVYTRGNCHQIGVSIEVVRMSSQTSQGYYRLGCWSGGQWGVDWCFGPLCISPSLSALSPVSCGDISTAFRSLTDTLVHWDIACESVNGLLWVVATERQDCESVMAKRRWLTRAKGIFRCNLRPTRSLRNLSHEIIVDSFARRSLRCQWVVAQRGDRFTTIKSHLDLPVRVFGETFILPSGG